MNNKNKNGGGKIIVAAAAGVAAVGAGAYYLFGPNRKTHQKKAKMLMEKIKREAIKEAKKAKELSGPVYSKAVDVIAKNYKEQYKLHEKDIRAIVTKLKSDWQRVSQTAAKKTKKVKSRAKKILPPTTTTKS